MVFFYPIPQILFPDPYVFYYLQGKNTDEKALDEKTKIAADLKGVYDKLRENDEKCANALKAAQARFEAISVGKFSSEEGGKSATLQQQLMDLKANLTNAQTTVKTSDMKLKHNVWSGARHSKSNEST